MKIGIFFGGQSREREISFAGGRTVYDNLNKSLFEPVPIFVDSLGNFIHLDWKYVYKGTIRDFYPPFNFLPDTPNGFQIYIESIQNLSEDKLQQLISEVGKKVSPEDFTSLFDFAFLSLHGPYGEDGNIQGILEWYNIPYSGSGILPSSIGINKTVQRKLMQMAGFTSPITDTLTRSSWMAMNSNAERAQLLDKLISKIGLPLVIKAPNQGSSIGVSILKEKNLETFINYLNKSFFVKEITKTQWESLNEDQKRYFIISLVDIREGIGMPVVIDETLIYHPEDLLRYLNTHFATAEKSLSFTSINSEEEVLFESFIDGKEFSCIVIQDENGNPLALPPTQIIKGQDVFDYRSKYLPGMSRKITPIEIDTPAIEAIRRSCEALFEALSFNVYARIDGFYGHDGKIYLNDPNTTSGMLPSSFFFHQAAEIGLNPSQFLTYIIRTSLSERIKTGKQNNKLRNQLGALDQAIKAEKTSEDKKIQVAVIMGGFSSERHISVESGRNIFEKLASSTKYHPIPVFLTGNESDHQLYQLPVNIMLKDNADDIKDKIHAQLNGYKHELLEKIKDETSVIRNTYIGTETLTLKRIDYETLADICDVVFIALHGRPGEDGAVQAHLDKVGLSYNGSGVDSSQITINKYETNEKLMEAGVLVAKHRMIYLEEWRADQAKVLEDIHQNYQYPFICKPADDGCSSAVKKIKTPEELIAFAEQIFREQEALKEYEAKVLNLKAHEEFPQKKGFLLEELISKNGAKHFLEITGGMLTHFDGSGQVVYEVFEPSEALASGEVLSLEEKFLAGEGQNITPARFAPDPALNAQVSSQVRSELERVAKILNVQGYCRIDAFVRVFEDGRVETIIIEINSLPGMTPATCIFHQSAINDYKPYDFIDGILDFGMKRKERIAL